MLLRPLAIGQERRQTRTILGREQGTYRLCHGPTPAQPDHYVNLRECVRALISKGSAMLKPNSLIANRYRLLTLKTVGAGASTYLAHDARSMRNVYVKIANHDSPHSIGCMQTELNVLSSVQHPNIVSLIASGYLRDDQLYLVLENINGRTLHDIIAETSPGVFNTLSMITAIGSAMEALHDAGFIHRDITPSNILVPILAGRPSYEDSRLIDFGCAAIIDPLTMHHKGHHIVGSPLYMAPEQVLAHPQSFATDIYGLGATAFAMLFGAPPFRGATLSRSLGILLTLDWRCPPVACRRRF